MCGKTRAARMHDSHRQWFCVRAGVRPSRVGTGRHSPSVGNEVCQLNEKEVGEAVRTAIHCGLTEKTTGGSSEEVSRQHGFPCAACVVGGGVGEEMVLTWSWWRCCQIRKNQLAERQDQWRWQIRRDAETCMLFSGSVWLMYVHQCFVVCGLSRCCRSPLLRPAAARTKGGCCGAARHNCIVWGVCAWASVDAGAGFCSEGGQHLTSSRWVAATGVAV